MTTPRRVLSAVEVHFSYLPGKVVLDGVNLDCDTGKFLAILGPNGSGKTTLLRCLLGWLRPDSGRILLNDRPLRSYSAKALARTLAYVPQFPTSAFAFPVQELVLMGRFAHAGTMGLAGKKDMDVARQAMEMTETLEFADRSLGELSGGQAQRVMLARALAQQPVVMLLDEPTSHLDVRNQLNVHRMMQRLAHEWGMAVVCVSHDINLAARFADELVLMSRGKVAAAGTPGEVIRKEILDRVYDVDTKLIQVEGQSVPIVVAR
jgi:iron complex transport system ATP-binding protein